jgi:hypothetical protein
MAASSSTRKVTGRARRRGACSTRKTATPRESGTLMTSAMTDDITVP